MAASLRVSSSFTPGNATLFPSSQSDDSGHGCRNRSGKSMSLLLRTSPDAGLMPQRRRFAGAVRAEKGGSKGNQADRASPGGGFSLPTLPEWAKWAFAGTVWLSSVPAWKKLRDVGRLVERVDEVVERVEDLAEKADHMVEDIVEDLPDGELKKALLQVEKASEEVVAKAKALDGILDKTNEVVHSLYNSVRATDKGAPSKGKEKDVPASME